ncbi:MAG: tetratricopeptide repeat protein [Methylococcaceae bacterium]
MKSLLLKSIFLTFAIGIWMGYGAMAQRVIKGTVYRDGKVAAGVTVEAQKTSEKFMTSFDGKYQITVPSGSKYLKFTFINESKKLDLEANTSDVIDFSFDGNIPVSDQGSDDKGVILKTSTELVAEKDKDFMSAFTLEKQMYDQKDYKGALPYWRILYRKYPKSIINIYLHGANIYQSLIEEAKDPAVKDLYIDSLMHIYDKRIKYFNQEGYVLGRQGTDYLKYKLNNENMTDELRKPILKQGYDYLERAVKLQGSTTEAPVLILLMQSTRGLFGVGELSKEKVIENYDVASGIINQVLQKNPSDKNFLIARENVDQVFQASGAADCEALISIYTPKYNQIGENLEELKKMVRMLDRANCDASPLFAKASEKLFQMEPSPEAAYNMARMFIKSGQSDKAQSYYKQAIEGEKDPMNLSKYYYEMAAISWTTNPQQAKTYLKKAIDNNPNNGKAYLLLGDVYAHNSKSYGENDFDHSMVFLVAVDFYNKAKKADPSITADANERINTYSQYFPSKEDIFFNTLSEGQTYQVGGWIGESTVIRARK